MKLLSDLLAAMLKLFNPPNYYRRRFRKYQSPSSRDFESLKFDWLNIGRDFRKVLVNYGKQ